MCLFACVCLSVAILVKASLGSVLICTALLAISFKKSFKKFCREKANYANEYFIGGRGFPNHKYGQDTVGSLA